MYRTSYHSLPTFPSVVYRPRRATPSPGLRYLIWQTAWLKVKSNIGTSFYPSIEFAIFVAGLFKNLVHRFCKNILIRQKRGDKLLLNSNAPSNIRDSSLYGMIRSEKPNRGFRIEVKAHLEFVLANRSLLEGLCSQDVDFHKLAKLVRERSDNKCRRFSR